MRRRAESEPCIGSWFSRFHLCLFKSQQLEARIRDLAVARPDAVAFTSPVEVPAILSSLGDRQMIYLHEYRGELVSTRLTHTGHESSTVADAERVRTVALHLLSAMRRSFINPKMARPDRVEAGLDELGEILLTSGGGVGETVVVPPPDLIALPWNAMATRVIPDTRVVVAPSADAWARAERRTQTLRRVAVVAGGRLAHSQSEAEAVARLYPDMSEVLIGDRSTVERVVRSMASVDLVHVVAHGHLRQDNPMFSAIELSDGNLNLYNLEEIESAPSTVVLSACDSVHGSVVSGLEMFGLSSVMLSRGSRSVLSTVAPIPDSPASIAAVERIHGELALGEGAAEALRLAQRESAPDTVDPSLALVVYGAG